MDIYLGMVLTAVLLETSYLVYRAMRHGRTETGSVLLDTSVLIDGRITAIARSGLISARLIVPRSVVRELQFMADRADHDKRERARYGLDVIEKLQQLPDVTVQILDDGTTSEYGVDEQLIILAQRSGAKLCTIDYNLNKAARVQSVEVININELAHALRVNHLPGEKIDVELVQPGQDKKQAVGYLDDGTMVVVEEARDLLGKTIHVELTRVLQTAAGRMMFARKLTKSAPERTYAKGEARSSMFASPSGDKAKQHKGEARSSMFASPSGDTGERSKRADQDSQTPTASASSRAQRPQARRTSKPTPTRNAPTKPQRPLRHKQSPEDKLVNLANK